MIEKIETGGKITEKEVREAALSEKETEKEITTKERGETSLE